MKNKKINNFRNKGILTITLKLSAVFLFFLGLTSLKAQNSLYVKETSNTQTIYGLSNVEKLTFNAGDMTVHENSGNTDIYSLSGIRYLSFSDFGTKISKNTKKLSHVLLFPNPVKDELSVIIELSGTGNLKVDIINIQGKIVNQRVFNKTNGKIHETIDITEISDGLYLCRLQYGNQYENIKFIKN